jgi:NAD(P)-dependent dehydrogenase (short-subunit alcohol dehydrogenase family)
MKLQDGDVAVVTGAASGIGFALDDRFASAGQRVVASDVDQAALDDATARLAERGGDVLGVRADVSVEAEVQALATTTVERFGGVHVVCNNAGVLTRSDPWLGPTSAWEWVFGVNLWGVIHGVRAFLPHLVLGGRGHVVNTASMAGLFPGLNAVYDATKHAVVAISENLYQDLRSASLPVGVSVLCPGWVNTRILDAERNWPDDRGDTPAVGAGVGVLEPHLRRVIAEGRTPAAVADLVVTCIEEERFWVLTHPDWMPIASARWDSIAEGVNPAPLDHIPGLPPPRSSSPRCSRQQPRHQTTDSRGFSAR